MESDAGMTKKKRKTTVKKPIVLPEYQGPKLKDVEVETSIFEDMKFMVASDPKSRTGDQDKRELMRLIHVNGGHCVQIANNQPSLFVVYGGTTIPYDLQLLMNKGVHDIVNPQWIHDSVARASLAPLKKRYFFHATANRQEADEYHSDSEDEAVQDANGGPSANQRPTEAEEADTGNVDANANTNGITTEPIDDDPSLADWFKVDGGTPDDVKPQQNSDTETDDDSDNADVNANAEEELDDDWFKVKPAAESSSGIVSQPDTNGSAKGDELDVKMGENDNVMEYDQNLIFAHLCFYLDSPDNARTNGMTVRSKRENDVTQSFAELSKKITGNGGNIVDLGEPKLTHIIIDKRDDSRRLELMKRTSKPKRRHLIIAEYVQACLDEGTLLDEDEFAP